MVLIYWIYVSPQVEFDEMGQVRGVTSEGETTRAEKVVCDPSYLPNKVDNVQSPYGVFNLLMILLSSDEFLCWKLR